MESDPMRTLLLNIECRGLTGTSTAIEMVKKAVIINMLKQYPNLHSGTLLQLTCWEECTEEMIVIAG